MVGQTVSHYRILEKLGGGGKGVVNKVEDTAPDVVSMPNGTGERVLVDTLDHALPQNLTNWK